MNYETIYNSLIQKRRYSVINRTDDYKDIEYHHIIPVSCNGPNDKRDAKYNNANYNIIGLTIREHFFAHLLLVKIYKQKYGCNSLFYKKMLSAIQYMLESKKYKHPTSRVYKRIKLRLHKLNVYSTTVDRIWVTNGKEDIFLKPNEKIPDGFHKGRTINFTEEDKKEYSEKIRQSRLGKKSWNSGKHGIYSDEYRKKISDSHADVSGENNGRYGSRSMYDSKTNTKKLVKKEDIQKYLDLGYEFTNTLKPYNNGIMTIYAKSCPDGFKSGNIKSLNH